MQAPFPAVFPNLKAFIKRGAREVASAHIPQRYIWTWEFPSPTNTSGRQALIDDPALMIPVLSLIWSAWPEFLPVKQAIEVTTPLAEVILTDAGGKAFAPADNRGLDAFLTNFAADYLSEARNIPALWDDDVFERLYQNMAASIERNGYRLAVWVPLFRTDASGVTGEAELMPSYHLLQPDDLTRDRLRNPFGESFGTPPRHYLRTWSTVTYNQPVSPLTPVMFQRCANAIRLAVGGEARVGGGSAIPEPGDCRPLGAASWTGLPVAIADWLGGIASVITDDKLPSIRQYAQMQPSLDPTHEIALRRFAQTAERTSGEDKLIDATIGLENLLLPGVEDELSFHFALRGAWLLGGSDAAKRRKIYSSLKRIYNVRSQVVHANAKAQQTLTTDVVEGAVNTLRDLLCLLLKAGMSRLAWENHVGGIVFGPRELCAGTEAAEVEADSDP